MKTVTSTFAEKNLDLGDITDADVQATLTDLDQDKDGKLSRQGALRICLHPESGLFGMCAILNLCFFSLLFLLGRILQIYAVDRVCVDGAVGGRRPRRRGHRRQEKLG